MRNAAPRAMLLCVFACALLACQNSPEAPRAGEGKNAPLPSPPAAKIEARVMQHHGVERVDPYYWLRDDTRSNPEVLAYLNAENAYTKAWLAPSAALRESLLQEMRSRMPRDESSVPLRFGQHWYYTRFHGDQEYPVFARKSAADAAEEQILLDINALATGYVYFDVGAHAVSPDERLLAYSVDSVGRRIYSIVFKDLQSGTLLSDVLQDTTGEVVWANDNQTVFYIRQDPQTLLGYQVYRHILGTHQDKDVLVYEETDSAYYTSLAKTRDDSTLMILHESTTSRGASLLSADTPLGKFQPFIPRSEGLEYSLDKVGPWFYLLTNWQAPNFRVMRVPTQGPRSQAHWQALVAHHPDVLLQDMLAFTNYLAISEKHQGQTRIRILNSVDLRSHVVQFEDGVYSTALGENPDTASGTLRLHYSALARPDTTYEYNMASRELRVLKRDEVHSDFDPVHYHSERIFITARDGQGVPVSLVYRRDRFNKNSSNPLYLYAYGAYGSTVEPRFSAPRLSLLDRGFVYAIAHVRGGQSLGRAWYEAGKLQHKMNSFTDFIDVTRALSAQGYAAADKIFAVGGSAGGLLVAGVANMAPELYRGISAQVPFVDVVTTMLDPSIPLTTNEYDEWGNPEREADFHTMLAYSPYDNVRAQDYPAMLVTTGLHDSQVQYFEPAKWVAKLRATKTDAQPLLLHINMNAGHGGASGRFASLEELAMEYGFFLGLLKENK